MYIVCVRLDLHRTGRGAWGTVLDSEAISTTDNLAVDDAVESMAPSPRGTDDAVDLNSSHVAHVKDDVVPISHGEGAEPDTNQDISRGIHRVPGFADVDTGGEDVVDWPAPGGRCWGGPDQKFVVRDILEASGTVSNIHGLSPEQWAKVVEHEGDASRAINRRLVQQDMPAQTLRSQLYTLQAWISLDHAWLCHRARSLHVTRRVCVCACFPCCMWSRNVM